MENKIKLDGNGNIILQDVTGKDITINYNDTEELAKLIQSFSNKQSFELKELLGNQNQEMLKEIRTIQAKLDEQQFDKKATKLTKNLDDFFKEIKGMKIKSAKKRILTNYKLLREYEELLILESDPKRKMAHEREIENLKSNIEKQEKELMNNN